MTSVRTFVIGVFFVLVACTTGCTSVEMQTNPSAGDSPRLAMKF